MEENQKVSNAWYLLPVFFGLLGGIIAWAVNKKNDPKKAGKFLWLGIVIFVITIVFMGVVTKMSLDQARSGANEASASSAMNQIRSLAEINRSLEGGYEDVSCENPEIFSLCEHLEELVGENPAIHSSSESYCGYVPINEKDYFCIDSNYSASKTSNFPGSEGYCDGETYTCP